MAESGQNIREEMAESGQNIREGMAESGQRSIREEMEQREREYFSPYAMLSSRSAGRDVEEPPCDIRPVFQRDRDRILHCKAFRRLKQKTQVFILPGDHYRTRLTHTLEVAQNARTIARALRLNEDLTEAVALGHDLGHTPYGHAGERALNRMCPLGFSHNVQSVRVVEKLEKCGEGLNLTKEVRDGILNHKTAGHPATLEGQIVRLADKIAYLGHDTDDAIRSQILSETDIPAGLREVLGNSSRERMDKMIHDVIQNSMGQPQIRMSGRVGEAMMELRAFMFARVYKNPRARSEEEKAVHIVEELYRHYICHQEELPEKYLERIERREASEEQSVCDFISGMTDSYAVKMYQEIFIPQSWKI